MGALEQACVDMSGLPDDMDEPFIPKLYFKYEDEDAEANCFRFFITTRRLLGRVLGSTNLHTDATYKVYPLSQWCEQ